MHRKVNIKYIYLCKCSKEQLTWRIYMKNGECECALHPLQVVTDMVSSSSHSIAVCMVHPQSTLALSSLSIMPQYCSSTISSIYTTSPTPWIHLIQSWCDHPMWWEYLLALVVLISLGLVLSCPHRHGGLAWSVGRMGSSLVFSQPSWFRDWYISVGVSSISPIFCRVPFHSNILSNAFLTSPSPAVLVQRYSSTLGHWSSWSSILELSVCPYLIIINSTTSRSHHPSLPCAFHGIRRSASLFLFRSF